MFESYWRIYTDILVKETYYSLYAQKTAKQVFAINAICLAFTVSGVVGFLGEVLPAICASAIVVASQIVSAIQVLLPYSDRLYAARQINSELQELSLHAGITVKRYLFDRMTEDELFDDMVWLTTKLNQAENKFAPADLFPWSMRLHEKAQKDALQFIDVHYVPEVKEDVNENTANP